MTDQGDLHFTLSAINHLTKLDLNLSGKYLVMLQ